MKLFFFFFIRGIFIFIFSFTIFSIVRTNFFKKQKKKSNPRREFFLSLFIGYIFILMLFLFTPNSYIASKGINLTHEHFDFIGTFKDRFLEGSWGMNFTPLRTIKSYIKYSGFFHACLNILGNIIIFIPMGIILPIISNNFKKIFKVVLTSLLISIFIEFIQFFIGRSVDIDDVILNTLGGFLGYIIYITLPKKYKSIGI